MGQSPAERQRRYRERHPERARECNKRSHDKYRERYNLKAKEYRKLNPPPKRSAAEQFVNAALLRRFESHITKSEHGCWLWTGHVEKSTGYGGFNVCGANVRTHRVAWLLYRGAIPDDLFVLHECDVRHCVNPNHLFLGTHDDNMKDALRKGRNAKGEKIASHKLTEAQALSVLERSRDGETQMAIANDLHVAQATVWSITSGRTWRHISYAHE